MENYFTANKIAGGIYHIYEPAGVCSTLILGDSSALLIDSGYGMKDLRQFVDTLTDLPITLANTHCHLDHAGGNYLWGQAYAHPFERQVYDQFNQPNEKASLLSVRPTPDDLNMEAYLSYKPCTFIELENHHIFDLGGRQVEAIHLPGHTRGSVVFYDHQTRTLMSGDEISNSVWIMFKTSATLEEFHQGLLELKENYNISQVLASHLKEPLPPKIIDYVLKALDNRNPQTSTLFVHPRHHYTALRHKEFVYDIPGIKLVYLVYPNQQLPHA